MSRGGRSLDEIALLCRVKDAEAAKRIRDGGRRGGLVSASRHTPQEMTAPMRRGAWAKFLKEVDPHNELPVAERNRRARYAQLAHMEKMRLARSRKQAAQKGAH